MQKETINIVWFKQGLRLNDHQPMEKAIESDLPSLLVYLYEPSLIGDPHYDVRHWRFVWESLVSMMETLSDHDVELLVAHEEVEEFFDKISDMYDFKTVFSHEETAIDLTYKRDLSMN